MKSDSLLFSIVRVSSGQSLGTGFLLEGERIITCAHNILDTANYKFTIANSDGFFNLPVKASLVHTISEKDGDIMCFEIIGELPHHTRPLLLTDCGCSQDNACSVYGFPRTNPEHGLPFNKAKVDSIFSRSEFGWPQIILTDAVAIQPGFSGSPVWDLERHALIGMLLHAGESGLARAIPAQTIADKLSMPCYRLSSYPGIELIDKRFLYEQNTNPAANLTATAFYTADYSAQWWGGLNGLVADKTLYKNLPTKIVERMQEDAPIVGLFEGTGGMGKTTVARRLSIDLHKTFDIYWIDETFEDAEEEYLIEFIEEKQREEQLILDLFWPKSLIINNCIFASKRLV